MTRDEVRAVDRRAIDLLGIPGVVLMENAGLGLTEVVCDQLSLGLRGTIRAKGPLAPPDVGERAWEPGEGPLQRGSPLSVGGVEAVGPVGVVCGRGNNGGDGFVVARHLALRGVRVRLAYTGSLAEQDSGDAATMRRICEKMALAIEEVADGEALARVLSGWTEVELLVDALYGNGLSAPLREPGLGLVRALDQDPRPKIACDVPSGLDCDTGLPLGHAVRCVRTATFVAEKVGFAKARAWTGQVTVVPIGCPVAPTVDSPG